MLSSSDKNISRVLNKVDFSFYLGSGSPNKFLLTSFLASSDAYSDGLYAKF